MSKKLWQLGANDEIVQASDLPYALVTPGEWEFSGSDVQSGHTYTIDAEKVGESYLYLLKDNGTQISQATGGEDFETEVDFGAIGDPSVDIVATVVGDSLPGHLLDRANNLIDATSGDVTLTLPPFQEGKVRDLLVHVNLGDDGTDPYTVTVNFPSDETNTGFKVKGNASAPIPAPDAAGEWLYSFSESSPHKMAVSLAQLQDATTGDS